jgi:hypothetical protein
MRSACRDSSNKARAAGARSSVVRSTTRPSSRKAHIEAAAASTAKALMPRNATSSRQRTPTGPGIVVVSFAPRPHYASFDRVRDRHRPLMPRASIRPAWSNGAAQSSLTPSVERRNCVFSIEPVLGWTASGQESKRAMRF